jgi:hypothetical protein
MLYLPLTFVEYNCHNPSSLTGQNNGSIFWFFRRLLDGLADGADDADFEGDRFFADFDIEILR